MTHKFPIGWFDLVAHVAGPDGAAYVCIVRHIPDPVRMTYDLAVVHGPVASTLTILDPRLKVVT